MTSFHLTVEVDTDCALRDSARSLEALARGMREWVRDGIPLTGGDVIDRDGHTIGRWRIEPVAVLS